MVAGVGSVPVAEGEMGPWHGLKWDACILQMETCNVSGGQVQIITSSGGKWDEVGGLS